MEATATKATTTAAAAAKKKKPNSPKAPGTSLRNAVAEVSKVYQRYSHGVFTKGELASALDMSANSGAFLGKASTLREYGLIEEAPGGERVTELFRAIYSAPVGSAELRRYALQAVSSPAIFARLLQQFNAKVPEESALALRLEMSERFNRDRATAVAAALRNSLNEYGLIDGNGNVLTVRGDETPRAERNDDEEEAGDEIDRGPAAPIKAAPGSFRVEVPLREGRKAILALPDDLTADDTRKICAVLGAYAAES